MLMITSRHSCAMTSFRRSSQPTVSADLCRCDGIGPCDITEWHRRPYCLPFMRSAHVLGRAKAHTPSCLGHSAGDRDPAVRSGEQTRPIINEEQDKETRRASGVRGRSSLPRSLVTAGWERRCRQRRERRQRSGVGVGVGVGSDGVGVGVGSAAR